MTANIRIRKPNILTPQFKLWDGMSDPPLITGRDLDVFYDVVSNCVFTLSGGSTITSHDDIFNDVIKDTNNNVNPQLPISTGDIISIGSNNTSHYMYGYPSVKLFN